MTLEERKKKAEEEMRNLLDSYVREEEKITIMLKRSGELTPGLDGNSEDYAVIISKYEARMREIFSKYDLPPDTKLKLW